MTTMQLFQARTLFSRLALVTVYLLRVLIGLFYCLRLMRVIASILVLRTPACFEIVLLRNT